MSRRTVIMLLIIGVSFVPACVRPSPEVPPGASAPSAGTPVKTAATKVKVPDVVSMDVKKARDTLEAEGFAVVVTEKLKPQLTEGTVFDQNPAAGEELEEGGEVTIWVAKAPAEVVVPDVLHMEADAAKQAITAAGLTPRVVTELGPWFGKVARQDPEAGATVQPGSTVTIVVQYETEGGGD